MKVTRGSFTQSAKRIIGDGEADRLLKGPAGTPRRGRKEFYRL